MNKLLILATTFGILRVYIVGNHMCASFALNEFNLIGSGRPCSIVTRRPLPRLAIVSLPLWSC
jgi:hypothetical protein